RPRFFLRFPHPGRVRYIVELETRQQPDHSLVARFRLGDLEAFGRLYQRHRNGLYGYALSICRDGAEAADLVQDLWLAFLQDADKLAAVVNVRAYLYRSLRNRALDAMRRRGIERAAVADRVQPVLVKPRDTVASQEEAARLNEAVER